MQENTPTTIQSHLSSSKLRLVHSIKRMEPDANRAKAVNGAPGITLPKETPYFPKGYSTDAVPGNYQGL